MYVCVYTYTRVGQNNRNTKQYRNKSVCVDCTERSLVISDLLLFFCLFTLCIFSVNALQVLFSNTMREAQNEGNCLIFK